MTEHIAPDGTPLQDDEIVLLSGEGDWEVLALTIPCASCGRGVRAAADACGCGAASPW